MVVLSGFVVALSNFEWFCGGFESLQYRNFPKFSDRQIWANSADPVQTAPRGAV